MWEIIAVREARSLQRPAAPLERPMYQEVLLGGKATALAK